MKLTVEQTAKLKELLQEEWTKKDGTIDIKMVDYCMKSAKYICINNDTFVDIGKDKPTIKSTIWYDDTTEDPGTALDTFIFENRYNIPQELEMTKRCETLKLSAKYNNRTNVKLCNLTYCSEDSDRQRDVTQTELDLINKTIRELQEDYKKRLIAYYKKYSHKICSCGYWADR